MKTPHKSLDSTLPKVCLGALAATHLACASPPVRPTPPAEECPAGAREAMFDEFHLAINALHTAVFPYKERKPIPVQEGLAQMRIPGDWEKLPHNTFIVGRLYFAEGRVHGRFTEARLPDGRRRPVCFLLTVGYERGVEIKALRGKDTVEIFPVADVLVVERFE